VFVTLTRRRFHITGIVQGVGCRPFVYGLATGLGLSGYVRNDLHGVVVEVEGDATQIDAFRSTLAEHPPPLAVLEAIAEEELVAVGDGAFRIEESATGGGGSAPVSPDVATCAACLKELFDPHDRRYRYPFINCTACGPRFTIMHRTPYDRANTTMAAFEMCHECRAEYEDPSDRRFHAEPIACPRCGPRLGLVLVDGTSLGGDPIVRAAELIEAGSIVAVKGLGGFHLACSATNETAVRALRDRKHREEKPFALMVRDLPGAHAVVALGSVEEAQLVARSAPILLAHRRDDAVVAPSVAPRNRFLGVVLPYTPVHHLLTRELDGPIVLTSANVADEPLVYRDEEAFARLGSIADAFLTHDRPIHMRCDDSVVRVSDGNAYPLRRSRGFAPQPLAVRPRCEEAILAVGAELKNTFCLAVGGRATLSHHIGDLENWDSFTSFTQGIEHFQRLFDVAPMVVAHDLHPEYLSTKWALALDDVATVGVQHHHAHLVSCLADNERQEVAIGLILDGTGFGDDGTIWGCEVLVGDAAGYERVSHLRPVALPGGVAAVREPWRMAAVYLGEIYGDAASDQPLDLVARRSEHWDAVATMARRGVNSPLASSAGRLFDAAAALCGVGDVAAYEGQAAVGLEHLVDLASDRAYGSCFVDGLLDGRALIEAVVDDLRAGTSPSVVAAAFHNGLVHSLADAAQSARRHRGVNLVALSGGTFQNDILLTRLKGVLAEEGFEVLVHRRVPPNDGGISLGQVVVANAQPS
jgi:hydrogenase maturation protein HypF